jgi:hypothetical protein
MAATSMQQDRKRAQGLRVSDRKVASAANLKCDTPLASATNFKYVTRQFAYTELAYVVTTYQQSNLLILKL